MRYLWMLGLTVLIGCGQKVVCAAGTTEVNGKCVLQCGSGTTEVNGQCVPRCGAGTTEVNGQCVVKCGAGTVESDAGTCVAAPPPKAGDSCTTGFACEDASRGLECIGAQWVALPCRGPSGCVKSGPTLNCDMTGDLAGDRCASTVEGRGLCTADGKGTLECRQAVLVKTNNCSSCVVMNDQVICSP